MREIPLQHVNASKCATWENRRLTVPAADGTGDLLA